MERLSAISRLHLSLFLIVMFFGGALAFAMGRSEPSLYDRLGGVYNIAAVVDAFIEKLYVNDTLNDNPKIKEARERTPKAGLKYRVTSFVAEASKGPEKYTGRTMRESHKDLGITEKEWDAMASDFKKTLDEFNVPEREQKELFELVGAVKGDILQAEEASPAPPSRGYGY